MGNILIVDDAVIFRFYIIAKYRYRIWIKSDKNSKGAMLFFYYSHKNRTASSCIGSHLNKILLPRE